MRRRISDPSMGGAYLTLLNTIANIGITVPKFFVFAGAREGLGGIAWVCAWISCPPRRGIEQGHGRLDC